MNISNLEIFVESINYRNRLFKKPELGLLNEGDRQEIANCIDCQLSPEVLTCDGERPRSEWERDYRFLVRCAQELVSIDPTVSFMELEF